MYVMHSQAMLPRWAAPGGSPFHPASAASVADKPHASEATSGPEKRPRILIVEDVRADVFMIREAIQSAGVEAEIEVAADGEKAIRYLARLDRDEFEECPAMLILDLNLPKRHGSEVFRELRRSRRCANLQVIVVTMSEAREELEQLHAYGAYEYFQKPQDFGAFMRLGDVVRRLLR